MIDITIPIRTYRRPDDAVRAAASLLGPDTPVEIVAVEGRHAFRIITTGEPMKPVNKPAPTGRNAIPTKIANPPLADTLKPAAVAQAIAATKATLDPNKVHGIKSNARREARKYGLNPDKALVFDKEKNGWKVDPNASAHGGIRNVRHKPGVETTVTEAPAAKPSGTNAKPEAEATAKAARKPAKPAKASKPAKAPKAKAKPAKRASAPRAGKDGPNKREIVANLLLRPEGCTLAEVRSATGWQNVTIPGQAAASGLTLRQEKVKGSPTRYWGTPKSAG